jgi:hypothetical protein
MSWMADASDEQTAYGEINHRLGHIEATLVVAHEAAKAGQPSEGAFKGLIANDKFCLTRVGPGLPSG